MASWPERIASELEPGAAGEHAIRRVVRPLLEQLGGPVDDEPTDAPPPPLESPATTLPEGKRLLIEARSQLVTFRSKVRRERWPLRSDVQFAIDDAVINARQMFWSLLPSLTIMSPTQDKAAFLKAAQAAVKEAVSALDLKSLRLGIADHDEGRKDGKHKRPRPHAKGAKALGSTKPGARAPRPAKDSRAAN
jgi:hypothetical protein